MERVKNKNKYIAKNLRHVGHLPRINTHTQCGDLISFCFSSPEENKLKRRSMTSTYCNPGGSGLIRSSVESGHCTEDSFVFTFPTKLCFFARVQNLQSASVTAKLRLVRNNKSFIVLCNECYIKAYCYVFCKERPVNIQ